MWVQELIDRIRNPIKLPRSVMPWRKTHSLIAFRPGEVTIWGGANGNGKSLVTGQVALSLIAQNQKVCIASFEMKPSKTLERMGRQFSGFNADDPAFAGSDQAREELVKVYEQFKEWTDARLWLYDQQGTVTTAQIIVHCRIGSSENRPSGVATYGIVHCRIGSSENRYNAIAHAANVHCRIGSSEKTGHQEMPSRHVHCRIGSSEITRPVFAQFADVHCRIGSSENQSRRWSAPGGVHCRIGSSEILPHLSHCSL